MRSKLLCAVLLCLIAAAPAHAFFHRMAVSVISNYFNGGGSQINRNEACYYCGQDRWINNWQNGDNPVMYVSRQVTISLSGGAPTVNFLNNAAMVANQGITMTNGSGTLPSCMTSGNTYFAITAGQTSTTMGLSSSSGPGASLSGCTGGSGTVTAAFQMGRGAPNQWNAVSDAGGTYVSAATGQPTVPLPTEVTSWGRGLFQAPSSVAGVYHQSNAVWGPSGVKWWLGTTWTLAWTGQLSTIAGSPVITGGSLGTGGSPGLVINGPTSTATTATVTYGSTTDPNDVAFTFAIDSSNRSNPPRLVKYYQTKYAAQVASSDPATQNINPDWISQFGMFGTIRWMPEMGTNDNFMTDSSQLADINYDSFGFGFGLTGSGSNVGLQPVPIGFNGGNGPKSGIAPSLVCLVSNKVGAHAHYNITTTASNQMATDIANDFQACMNPGLQVKYEFCNEIWNFGAAFHCFYYLNSQPWPPLNPSNPLSGGSNTSAGISIASITVGNPTTITCTPNCGTLQNGYNVGFSLAFSDTAAIKLNNIIFGVSGCIAAPCTSFTVNATTTGLTYSSGGLAYPGGVFQIGRSIASITPGSPTTITCTPDCGGIITGSTIGLHLNASDSMTNNIQSVLWTAAACTGTPCTSFTIAANTTGLSYSSGGIVYLAGGATTIGGYRSAELMQSIHDAYGSGNRSRWRGVLGGQFGNTAVASGATNGANFYLNVEAPSGTKFTDLYDEIDVAPYYGNGSLNGTPVTSVSIGATPTVVWSGTTFTTGQQIRFYAKSGMTQIDNMTATLTCSPCTSTGTINIDTSAFSAWINTGGNFIIDNRLPLAADTSIADNGSNPSVYPTKYSYFAGQMSEAVINGVAAASGYVVSGAGNLATGAGNGIAFELGNAVIANEYGLVLGEYEGGNGFAYLDTNGIGNITSNGPSSNTLWDFVTNWQYDSGPVGGSYTPVTMEIAHYNMARSAGVNFPSQFLESGAGAAPFNFTRYFGEATSAYTELAALNAQGPCFGCTVNPSLSYTYTYAGNTTNRFFFSSGCSSCTDTAAGANLGTGASTVFVLVSASGGGALGVPTAVTCDTQVGGSPVSLTLDIAANNGGNASIWRGALTANASTTRTCTVTYTGTAVSSQFREYYIMTVTGLTNPSAPDFIGPTTGGTQSVSPITFGTNSLVLSSCDRPQSNYSFTLTGWNLPSPANPTTITLAMDNDGTTHTGGFAAFSPTFNNTTATATCSSSNSGAQAVATYH